MAESGPTASPIARQRLTWRRLLLWSLILIVPSALACCVLLRADDELPSTVWIRVTFTEHLDRLDIATKPGVRDGAFEYVGRVDHTYCASWYPGLLERMARWLGYQRDRKSRFYEPTANTVDIDNERWTEFRGSGD